jgi:hypothetical protein
MLAVVSGVACHAQDRVVNTRHLAWTGILGEYKFNENWSAWMDAQFRYEYTDGDVFQWCVRPYATWKSKKSILLSPGISYWQLYANPNELAEPRPEIRPWQEVAYKFKPNARHVIYPRARFEQRFIREYAGADLDDQYTFHSFRLRLRVDYTFEIRKESLGRWFLFAGNEFFVYQKTNGFSAFDQNRAWAGVGFRFGRNHNIQLSYLYLYQQRSGTVADQFHIPRVIYQFTLTPKPKEVIK